MAHPMNKVEEIEIPPEVEVLFSLKRTGYAWAQAVMDIFDNHVDAVKDRYEDYGFEEGLVRVRAISGTDGIEKIMFADNGMGIPKSLLKKILRLGKSAKRRRGNKRPRLGVFGMGLKTAGMSLANKIIVISRTKGNEIWFTEWDVEDSLRRGKFICQHGQSEDYSEFYEKELGDGPGTVVLLEELKADVPKNVTTFHRTLRKNCAHVYRHLLSAASSAGFYFPFDMKVGKKKVATINDPVAYDHENTSILIGKPDGSFEKFTAPDGTEVRIRMVHHRRNSGGDESANREKYDNMPGAYMPGNHYKQGVYWIRQGREIYCGPFWKNLQGISNVYAEVIFEDTGDDSGQGNISMDFGKKGVVVEDELADWLKSYVFNPRVKAALKKVQTDRQTNNAQSLEELAKDISEKIFSPNCKGTRQKATPAQAKLGSILKASSVASRKNSKYRGQTFDVGGSSQIEYDIEFRSWPGDIAYNLEVDDDNHRMVLVINSDHDWIKDNIIALAEIDRAATAKNVQLIGAHANALNHIKDDEEKAEYLANAGYMLRIFDSSFGLLNLENEPEYAFEEDADEDLQTTNEEETS